MQVEHVQKPRGRWRDRIYESAFGKLLFPAYESLLKRRPTVRYINEADAFQWLTPAQIKQYQDERLSKLIKHCWDNVPYYRRVWTELGLRPESIRRLEDLKRLPVLTKSIIRENYESLIAENHRGELISKATGGSTGEPLRFSHCRDAYDRRMGVMWRGYGWAGSRPGRRTLYLWGLDMDGPVTSENLKERLYHALFARKFLNSFALNDENLGLYAQAWNRYQPQVVVGYVTPMVDLAKYVLESGVKVHSPSSILTGAEALHEPQRELIEQAFACPVFNTYGSREFMLLASECEQQQGLHLSSDSVIVETVDSAGETVMDEVGSMLVTDLHNFGMPFIRYENGDLAVRSDRACACGRGLPLLERVEGRVLDQIVTAEGGRLPGEFFPHLLKDSKFLRRFQVIQESLSELQLRVVVENGELSAEQESELRSLIASGIGPTMTLKIEVLEEIPVNATGKHRVTINRLDSISS